MIAWLDAFWTFWLADILKPLLVAIAAALHLAFLLAAWLVLAGVRDFAKLEAYLRAWRPIRPEIFSLEETDDRSA
jgi:hypothetical protein